MKSQYSIAFVLPYFGHLPSNFDLWLKSCEKNATIDFLIFTDDNTKFYYPSNVKVHIISFEELKNRIQLIYDFDVLIDCPWRLSLFKPAYGDIFKNELSKYDYWGYCDADLMWGDIRKFVTDEILEKYDRIGTKGHASIYRNTPEVNARYKIIASNTANYKDVFSGRASYSFDENGMDEIYDLLNVPYYFRPNFAHLEKFESGFYLKRLPKEKLYTNKYQVFLWESGHLYRLCLDHENIVKTEYMYIHFFCRPMKYYFGSRECNRYIIYPDVVKPYSQEVTQYFIKKKGTQGKFKFLLKMIWFNRNKINVHKILKNISHIIAYKKGKNH